MPPPATMRSQRERELVEATRALFDERGLQDAPIDEIARAVGINKALIYRVFASKEELFVLTVTHYLDELREAAADATDLPRRARPLHPLLPALPGVPRLRAVAHAPPGGGAARAGRARASGCGSAGRWPPASRRWRRSLADEGVAEPDFTANRLYTQVLGTMHLARLGVGVRESAPGVPDVIVLDPERVRRACVEDALALALARSRPS